MYLPSDKYFYIIEQFPEEMEQLNSIADMVTFKAWATKINRKLK